jgi:protein phosphatase
MGLHLNIAGKTDKGKKRSKNEDCFAIDPELGFMIVADGMGGHAAGEVASRLATTLCTQQLKRALQTGHVPIFNHTPPSDDLDPRSILLSDCIKFSNQAVFEASQKSDENKHMGTTLVAALWLDDKLAIAHVGDSRLYYVHDGDMVLCTSDHSFVQEQVDHGLMSSEDAEKSDLKNMLTRSIGMKEDVAVDLKEIPVQEGDYILLCSDGLTKMLKEEDIEREFVTGREPQEIADNLIRKANDAGGGDNITTIVARLEPRSHWDTLTNRIKNAVGNKL